MNRAAKVSIGGAVAILLVALCVAAAGAEVPPADGALQWVEVGSGSASGGGITNNAGNSFGASLALDSLGNPYVAWTDQTSGNQIYVKRFDGANWVEVGAGSATASGISNSSGTAAPWLDWPSLDLDTSDRPYVAWHVYYGIHVKRFDGASWVPVGMGSATAGGIAKSAMSSDWPFLVLDSSDKPYVAWQDTTGGVYEPRNIYIKRFDGADWLSVGSGSATGGGISNQGWHTDKPSLALNSLDNPYVAWHSDATGNYEIYVKRFDGAGWVEVGSGSAGGGGISANSGDSEFVSLALDASGNPYVAWHDNSSGNYEIYVKRFDGATWLEVGAGSATGGGISNTSGTSYTPSLALDGSGNPWVAWTDDSSGNSEIYVKRFDGASWLEVSVGSASGGGISNTSGTSNRPGLAIDTSGRPYVVWGDNSSGNYEIYIRRGEAVGPGPAPLLGRIAFCTSRDGNYDLYVMDANGDNQAPLKSGGGWNWDPDWSPDGSRVAYYIGGSGVADIYVRDLATQTDTRLTWTGNNGEPAWSPDGNRIAFVTWRDGNVEVYVMDANATNLKRCTWNPAEDAVPAWSPDGNQLAFVSNRTGVWDIWVMNASDCASPDSPPSDPPSLKNLTNDAAQEWSFDWSPDGTQMVVASNRDGVVRSELFILDLETRNWRRLTDNAWYDMGPSWSPDGKWIAFGKEVAGGEIFAIDPITGYEVRLTSNEAWDGGPDWWGPTVLAASIDIKPDTLNLKSKGRWVTAYVELPEGYDAANIDVATVLLEEEITAVRGRTRVGDYDSDGISDLMVKFRRQQLVNYLRANGLTSGKVQLSVTGNVGTFAFEGADSIRVRLPRRGGAPREEPSASSHRV